MGVLSDGRVDDLDGHFALPVEVLVPLEQDFIDIGG